MPIRIPGETDAEAVERSRRRVHERRGITTQPIPQTPPGKVDTAIERERVGLTAPVAPRPVPTPPPGGITPRATPWPEGAHRPNESGPMVDEGTKDERFPTWLSGNYEVGSIHSASFGGKETQRYRFLSKKRAEFGGLWEYEVQNADIFRGWNPQEEYDTQEAYQDDVIKYAEWWEALDDPHLPNGAYPFLREVPATLHGEPMNLAEAYTNLHVIYKTLEAFGRHLEDELPEAVAAYGEEMSKASDEGKMKYPTMNATDSVAMALNDFADKHPDDYTQRLASEEGFAELGEMALARFTSLAPPEVNLFEHPGEFVKEVERAYIPEVPFLKDTIVAATDIFTDPIMLGSMFIPGLAPVGLASKARFLGGIAIGGAVGEEAAEAAGVPGPIGSFVGMVAGPLATRSLVGFGRALRKESAERALINPVAGEPATEILKMNGQVLSIPEVERSLAGLEGIEPQPLNLTGAGGYQSQKVTQLSNGGTVTMGQVEGIKVGMSAGPGVLDPISISINRLPTETPSVRSLTGLRDFMLDLADKNPFRAIEMDVANPKIGTALARMGAEEVEAGVMRLPPKQALSMAGSAKGAGSSVEFMERLIRIHIERPEAEDWLRKIGRGMGHIPGAKRVPELINRQVLAENPPLKAAFGYEAVGQYDNAIRDYVLADFRGTRVPFRQNSKAQIWVPDAPGAKNGKWVAHGDVFESVLRGEPIYMKRLTAEQVDFIRRADAARAPFVKQAELVTGQKIAKRDVHWARFVEDVPNKKWTVRGGGAGKPPGLFQRQFELQEEAITGHGIRYKPDLLKVLDTDISSWQRLSRQVTLHKYLTKEGIIKFGPGPARKEVYATPEIAPALKGRAGGYISIEHMNELKSLMGPMSTNPVITGPAKVNAVARLLLTGIMDTGVGSLQLSSLLFTNPEKWGEAMGRSLWNMFVEPKQFYRFLRSNGAARDYIRYGGNVGLESEFFEMAQLSMPFRVPGALEKPVELATWPARTLVNRMQTGFDSALAYGRIFAFESLSGPALHPGPFMRAMGARSLEGQAYHDEMFRLSRFVDTMIGQPGLKGIIPHPQHQFESAWVWFATRYTRSMLGSASYMFGKGYTPAAARAVLARMLIGGMIVHAGFVYGMGKRDGKSDDEILQELKTTFNPMSGKKFMSRKVGKDWYGLGGVYRAGFSAIGTLGDVDNWKMDTWRERSLDNPFVRIWRSRTTPITGTLMDFMEGEDFIGREVNFWDMVDDPRQLGEYAGERFAPFTLNAILQDGDWQRKTARGVTAFFGLRNSPETAWEAMQPVMNRVSQERYGVDFKELEHNMVAQDLIRNHPSVKAIEAGYGPPILRSAEEKKWEVYRTLRDGIRDKYAKQKDDLDDAYINGHTTGRDYADSYRVIQASEFAELMGSRDALAASIGMEFEDKEAPAGTVDAALRDYFEVKVEDYKNKTTQEVDWDSYFADRDAALAQVPDEFKEEVDTYLNRHQGQIAKDFRKQFDSIIKPSHYFDMREQVAEGLDIPLNELEGIVLEQIRREGRRVSLTDIGAEVDDYLNEALLDKYGEDAPTINDLKEQARESNPRMDVELYRQGYTTTVRSPEALALAIQLKNDHPELGYYVPTLAKDILRSLVE